MEERSIYKDIKERTGGDIYIGVVGPVRTGKSTFIKRFVETLVLPNIRDDAQRARARDELPQSAGGRTIMTTEPKFVPETAMQLTLPGPSTVKVRLIDCVGYIVDSAMGYMEENGERIVNTPWSEEGLRFREAAELGTRKVISEHSTIGILVTTDGSIGEIDRADYLDAEQRVVEELKASKKPFVILLNTTDPRSESAKALTRQLSQQYGVQALAVDCASLDENAIKAILASVLFEFPVREIRIRMPKWIHSLKKDAPIRAGVSAAIRGACEKTEKIREVEDAVESIGDSEFFEAAELVNLDLGKGRADLSLKLRPSLFFEVLSEKTGMTITDERELMEQVFTLSKKQARFDKIASAYNDVLESGYGIVMPTMEELELEEPQIVRQSGKYGIRLKASAPSIHMMRVNTTAEVTPIVGSEQQSEELVTYLLKEFEENPKKIWESNIFGKSVSDLVGEGLHNKLYRMPPQARKKVGETIERIINDGCNGLICIIL